MATEMTSESRRMRQCGAKPGIASLMDPDRPRKGARSTWLFATAFLLSATSVDACTPGAKPRERRRWAAARHAVWDALRKRRPVPRHIAVLADEPSDACPVGSASMRLLGAFHLSSKAEDAPERVAQVRAALRPIWRQPWPELMRSEWPIFALLALHARSNWGTGNWTSAAQSMSCPADLEELREDLYRKAADEVHVPMRQRYADALRKYGDASGESSADERCELGRLLPLAAWAASLQCHARRSARVLEVVRSAVLRLQRRGDPARYLAMGEYAVVFFTLLHRIADAFKAPITEPLVVSYDPVELELHAPGLDLFTQHLFNSSGFKVEPSVLCAPVWVGRDTFPPYGYKGVTVYLDHEAGLASGRQVGTLPHLAHPALVYLGVREPLAETSCAAGTTEDPSRICVQVLREHSKVVEADRSPSVLPLPYASGSFIERQRHSPLDLATTLRSSDILRRPGGVGYLAGACVANRERLFDLLVGIPELPADALGECSGSHPERNLGLRNTRREEAFMDHAVDLFRDYRFAIAFENKYVPGYVTEKIVNAFLAGAIPIYWGSDAVLEIFNEDAFVFANRLMPAPETRPLEGLERVAEEIRRIAADSARLRRMATAPVLSQAQLRRWFSWHRGVSGNALGAKIRRLVVERLGMRVPLPDFCADDPFTLCTRSVEVPLPAGPAAAVA
eukprot:TRINITY_DN54156_c0_g1_i1.p1 TRINITY_DN54156_c0_g1~~TRINITY_DN54156_c0_g1_i1.p1  ORF type:complete len:696 (+),score=125.55 TRINITY_DN54156_c0_g1_i1:48-2090(+)